MFGKYILVSGFIVCTIGFCKAHDYLPRTFAKQDTIKKAKSPARITKKPNNANIIRLFQQDSVNAINMQKEYFESQAPGYRSPEIIAAETRTKMIDEMVKDGILADRDDRLGYQFNDTELTINGKKQPQSVFEKYRPMMTLITGHSAKYKYLSDHIRVKMIQDSLIGNDNWAVINLSYELNDKEFIVNGIKQPYDVFQKYYKEFIKPLPGAKWKYESHMIQRK